YDFAIIRLNTNGALDPTFNTTGKTMTPVGTNSDIATAIALQPDGKILVAGFSTNGGTADFVMVRYHPDGSLDSSYGSSGKVVIDLSNGGNDFGYGLAIDSLGRATVAADIAGLFGVARFNGDPFLWLSANRLPNRHISLQGQGIPGLPHSL